MSSTSLEHCQRYAALTGSELSMTFNFHHLKVDYPDGEKMCIRDSLCGSDGRSGDCPCTLGPLSEMGSTATADSHDVEYDCAESVSYTHLDVYKRQLPASQSLVRLLVAC